MALFLCCGLPSLSTSGTPNLVIESLSLERSEAHRVLRYIPRDTNMDFGKHKVLRVPHGMERTVEVLSASKTCHRHTLDGHRQTGLERNGVLYSKRWNEDLLGQLGPETDISTYASLLRHCTSAKALSEGERVHEHMTWRGCLGNRFLSNLLVQMYSKCGALEYARVAFNKMLDRNVYSWTIMIAACAQNGHSREALLLFRQMQEQGFEPDKITFICVLDACASLAALEGGQEIHAAIIGSNGLESNVVVGTSLVNMYGKCGSLDDATTVFQRNVVTWNAMIASCAQNGHSKEGLQIFCVMQTEGFEPDKITFTSILDVCASMAALEKGRVIHATMVSHGWKTDILLGTALVNMYGKCRSLDDARAVFTEDFKPDKATFTCVLDACAIMAALKVGQEIHSTIVSEGWESDVVVGTALVHMYGKCWSLDDAKAVFTEMPLRNVVSWSAMMAACTLNRKGKEALQLFEKMQATSLKPDTITFVSALHVCATVGALEEGQEIHATVGGNAWEIDDVLGTALVNIYGKCGSLDDARAVFADMPLRGVFSWNSMMAACAQNGLGKEALQLFGQMQAEGFELGKVTYICVLDACACMAEVEEGRLIHVLLASNGWESDVVVGTALVNMYGKSWSLDDAKAVFADMPVRNVISWNAMISTFAQNGYNREALQLFYQMQEEDLKPDKITCTCILDACACVESVEEGQKMHATIIGNEWELDTIVGNALVNMYGKCGSLDDARDVFSGMLLRDVVSWSGLMSVCAQNGHGKEALQLFAQMQVEGVKPNKVTFICALDACAIVAALEQGCDIHATVTGNCWEVDVVVGTAIINMYGKCGSIEDARAFFAAMPLRDVFSWNATMTAYAQNGHSKEALHLFSQMQAEGVKPDKVTYICVLTACGHTGLVADGRKYFSAMSIDHGISPLMEHYVCMIDLLGRGGLLEEAEQLIISMPFEHIVPAWLSLLSSCRIHIDRERALRAANNVFKLDPRNASTYVLLKNTRASLGRSDDAIKAKRAMIKVSNPGHRCIQVNNIMHKFGIGGASHSQQEVFMLSCRG